MPSILKSTSYYTVANVLPQFIGFLFLPIYSVYMTPSDFGIVSAMETLAYIFSILVSFNLDRAAQRLYFDKPTIDAQQRMLSTLFISTLSFSLLFIVLAFLSEALLQPIYSSISFYPYFAFCILSSALNSMSLIASVYYQISEQPVKYLMLKVSRFVLQILLVVYFVVLYREGALGHLKAELLAVLIFLPVYCYIAHKNFKWGFDFRLLKQAMSYSWPFIPTLLIAWVLNLSDRIFLERYVGLEELGVYSMGYKISTAFLVVSSAFTIAYTPIFYKLAASEDQGLAKRKIYKYGCVASMFFIYLMLAVSLLSKEVSSYLIDSRYEDSYEVVRIVVVGHFLAAVMSITSVLYLLQAKLTKLNMYIALVAGITNILLNFLLIPDYGMYGAAIATLLSVVILTLIQYIKSKDGYFISFPWHKITILIFITVLIVAIFHFYLEVYPVIAFCLKILLLSSIAAIVFIKQRPLIFSLKTQ